MFKRSHIINKRLVGNALAYVVIIGGIAGTTTGAIAYMVLKDSAVSSKQQDSQTAYQAATAGIKLGRLYNKYNHNDEKSSTCLDNTLTSNISPSSGNNTINCAQAPTGDLTNAPIRIYLNRLGCDEASLSKYDAHSNPLGGSCVGMPQDVTAQYNPKARKSLADDQLNDTDNPFLPYWRTFKMGEYNNSFGQIPADEQVVDLKIWYKDKVLGDPSFFCKNYLTGDCANSPIDQDINGVPVLGQNLSTVLAKYPNLKRLNKDEPISLSLDKSKTYYLFWHPIYDNPYDNEEQIWNDDQFSTHTTQIPNGTAKEYFSYKECSNSLIDTNGDGLIEPNESEMTCGLWFSKGLESNPGIQARTTKRKDALFLTNDRFVRITDQSEIRFKPVRTDIIFSLVSIDGGLVDSLTTHIESTGYFGGSKRKVEAKIDRQTNKLIGIFDYALYSEEAIKP